MAVEPTLFDAAARARDAATSRHDKKTTDLVVEVITRHLRTHEFIHTDDVWPLLDEYDLPPGRYIGAAFQRLQRDRLMAKVPVWTGDGEAFAARASVRSNLSPKWIYRSLIYSGRADV